MPYQTISVRRARHFTPDEAHAIAAELRAIAGEARDLAVRLRDISRGLDATWEGQAKSRYIVDFNGEPPVGESNADWLEAEAQRVSSITVVIMERVLERVWIPDPQD